MFVHPEGQEDFVTLTALLAFLMVLQIVNVSKCYEWQNISESFLHALAFEAAKTASCYYIKGLMLLHRSLEIPVAHDHYNGGRKPMIQDNQFNGSQGPQQFELWF